MRLAGALRRYWPARGHIADIVAPLSVLCDREGPDTLVVATLNTLSYCLSAIGRHQQASVLASRALRLSRHVPDAQLNSEALYHHSRAAYQLGDLSSALTGIDTALASADTNSYLAGMCRNVRSGIFVETGDFTIARDELVAALVCFRSIEDIASQAWILANLARIEIATDHHCDAADHLVLAQHLAERVGDLNLKSWVRYNAGLSATLADNHVDAYQHFIAALTLTHRTNDRGVVAWALLGCAYNLIDSNPILAATILAHSNITSADFEQAATPLEADLERRLHARLEHLITASDLQLATIAGSALSYPNAFQLMVDNSP